MKVFDVKITYKNGIIETRTVTAKDDVEARKKAVTMEQAEVGNGYCLIDHYCEVSFVRELSKMPKKKKAG